MTSDEAVQITLTALIRAIYTTYKWPYYDQHQIYPRNLNNKSNMALWENKVTDHKGLNREIVLILKRPNAIIVFNENSSNYFLRAKFKMSFVPAMFFIK